MEAAASELRSKVNVSEEASTRTGNAACVDSMSIARATICLHVWMSAYYLLWSGHCTVCVVNAWCTIASSVCIVLTTVLQICSQGRTCCTV